MTPSPGRIVLYRLSDQDVAQARMDRQTSGSTKRGNPLSAGDIFPMMITKVWGPTEESAVQGQVFLDGNDALWVTSRVQGDEIGQWYGPPRA